MNDGGIGGWIGLIGVIGGVLIGLAGGVFGAWCSIKNTNGPRERAYVVRCSVICFLFVLAFLAALTLTPAPWKWLWWLLYVPLLTLGIRKSNQVQQRIRREEAMERQVRG